MPRVKSDSFNRKVRVYDENFEVVEKPVSGKLPLYKTYEEAVNAIGNQENILEALNQYARNKVIQDAISQVTGGMEEKYILQFIRPMRLSDQFKDIAPEKDQTAAILSEVKKIPFLFDQLKSYCKNKAEEGDESDE